MSDGGERRLSELRVGERGRIVRHVGAPTIVQRAQEMGLLEGEALGAARGAPLGDPIAIVAAGLPLTLRRREAEAIVVRTDGAGASERGR